MSGQDATHGEAAPGAAEREAYEARIAELERRQRSIDELTRFRIEAYKSRLAELKHAEAAHLAEKRKLAGELEALRRRHDALAREVRRLGGQAAPERQGEGA